MEKFINRHSLKFKILGIIFMALFLITCSLGFLAFQFSKARIITMLGDSIRGIAAAIAGFVPFDDVILILDKADEIKLAGKQDSVRSQNLTLHGPKRLGQADEPAPASSQRDPKERYVRYASILQMIKKVNNIDSSINICVVSGGRLLNIVTSEDAIFTGASYALRPEAKAAVLSGMAKATGIYADKDGMWISAYAPGEVLPSDDGVVMVEINYRIDTYVEMLRGELSAIVVICIIGFLIAAFISYRLVTALAVAIERLDAAIGNLEKENYDSPIDIASDDEVGHLARTFELLRKSIKSKIEELRLSLKNERMAHMESVVALTNAIEGRDPYTKEHVNRVQHYALLIAKAMHLSHEEITLLKYSCFLHDVGKIYIDNSLLNKARVTDEEFKEIKKHAERGARIIEGIKFLSDVKDVVLHHQEWYNGKGYPNGLKGDEIPLLARIVSVADAFDAMTTDRPYKPKISFKEAMDEIERKSGTQFDPEVCAAFLKYRDTIEDMVNKRFNGESAAEG
ncbi:MAG: HD-GYP domain-containing protein [Candidatus Omnitrophica bacterium]|nr:HD-GYP domain-containing protein [Candidatus Omnitrophota bacterium]